MMHDGKAIEQYGNRVILRCAHRQAEPVVLSTGETVACVCVECLAGLGPTYAQDQLARALREAYCRHTEKMEITDLGSYAATFMCQSCGAQFLAIDPAL